MLRGGVLAKSHHNLEDFPYSSAVLFPFPGTGIGKINTKKGMAIKIPTMKKMMSSL